MTTKDYRGRAQSPRSRNSPSADDKNLEGCLPGPSTSPQIRETPRQESVAIWVRMTLSAK